eukprot:scaffold23499_cov109-Cylindrotheca_fusiformis.AAC.6
MANPLHIFMRRMIRKQTAVHCDNVCPLQINILDDPAPGHTASSTRRQETMLNSFPPMDDQSIASSRDARYLSSLDVTYHDALTRSPPLLDITGHDRTNFSNFFGKCHDTTERLKGPATTLRPSGNSLDISDHEKKTTRWMSGEKGSRSQRAVPSHPMRCPLQRNACSA